MDHSDRGKAAMEEEKEEERGEIYLLSIDGDEGEQGNEEEEVDDNEGQSSELDTMTSMEGAATSDDAANPRKRKPSIPSFFKCGEKSLKTSSDGGLRIEMYRRNTPSRTDASSRKRNGENSASSASLAQHHAPLKPPEKLTFSHESSSTSPKPPAGMSIPWHLLEELHIAAVAEKRNSSSLGNSESSSSWGSLPQQCAPLPPPANSSTGQNFSEHTYQRGRFLVTCTCSQPSVHDSDRNPRLDSSLTNLHSANADDDNSYNNRRRTSSSTDLRSAAAGDDSDRNRRLDNSSSKSNKEVDSAPKGPHK